MFKPLGLLKNVSCPAGQTCQLYNCMFSHSIQQDAVPSDAKLTEPLQTNTGVSDHSDSDYGGVTKRRKLDDGTKKPVAQDAQFVPIPKYDPTRGIPELPSEDSRPARNVPQPASKKAQTNSTESLAKKPPQTLNRPVSPPSLQSALAKTTPAKGTAAPAKKEVKETLNPRMIPNDPAGHAKRTLYVRHMHEQMKVQNTALAKSTVPNKEALTLTDDELIKFALDVEEKLARENANVYANVIKNQIAKYKKMKLEEWRAYVLETFVRDTGKVSPPAKKSPPPLDTGLATDQEHFVLSRLVIDQAPLAKFGYVPTPPTPAEIEEARAAVAASLNHETCDRCGSRFRIYPDRRQEDGALTTNGPCVHHWGRKFTLKREKTDAITGPKQDVYTCCHEALGTRGCTTADSHVFKISEAKRLASVLPFVWTPENANPAKGPDGKVPAAVTFDCEMGYTVYGLELIRLTATSWPDGQALIDVLVRPQGAVLDLNSRFSGVFPEAFASAIPYGTEPPPPQRNDDSPPSLPVVDSPQAARGLLCSFITPQTPLIGHAIDNDLNTVRLCHPTVIDSVILFPHPRKLPYRFGLKMLTSKYLGREIQTGGAAGHDSLEDARATGDLIRWKVGEKWKQLKREGWVVDADGLRPPLPPGLPPRPSGDGDGEEKADEKVLGAGGGVKRQRIQIQAGAVKKQKAG
ncbi:RNA exonuclease 3 [Taxawa tesnikishii (nom. ined.)]|nr:RNA exonuclease 3 [Dothideales sp. JES 119]